MGKNVYIVGYFVYNTQVDGFVQSHEQRDNRRMTLLQEIDMMKTKLLSAAVVMLLLGAVTAFAVPPAYEGQFGNPEEPALRVVKWPWLGVQKLAIRTHAGLKEGIQNDPADAVCKGARGAASGSATLVDHTARGMIYSPLPPKESLRKTVSYEEAVLAALEKKEAETCAVENGDTSQETAASGGTDGDESADATGAEEKSVNYLVRKVAQTPVEKAQRKYVPEKAAYRDRVRSGGGNLLRLAR